MTETVQNTLPELDYIEEAVLLSIAHYAFQGGATPVQLETEVPVYTAAPIPLPTIVKKLDHLKNIGYAKVEHGANAWTLTGKGHAEAFIVSA